MMRRTSRRRGASTAATMLAAAILVLGALPASASAAPPSGRFLNPDAPDAGGDGPGNIVSDKPDGTDGLYHFVLRLKDADGLDDIATVEIEIEDGDADAEFESIGTAGRVGTTDTWELKWNQSAHEPAGDVNDDPGAVRAHVTDSTGDSLVPSASGETVLFRDQLDETAEITSPENGADLRFFDGPDADSAPEALIEGTASSGINDAEEIELYYTTQADAAADPDWIDCEESVSVDAATGSWQGSCELAAGTAPADVTAVAVRTDDGAAGEDGNESGDAHRVRGVEQTAQDATIEITPTLDAESIGFCNTYTVTVRDAGGALIVGANVDIHAVGPADNIQFADNRDDPDDAGDGVSDLFSAPDDLVAPPNTHLLAPAAGCDTAGEAPPGDAPDDNDSDMTGLQGLHVNATGPDTIHIEGITDATGFQFSLDSETAGTTAITAWFDAAAEDDVLAAGEPQATAGKTWQVPVATTVEAVPEDDTNDVETTHQVTATVRDQNGNRQSGQTVHFRVTAGPHADDDLDDDPGTPPGYFGSCITNANGRCSQEYTGSKQGTDTITVFVNVGPGETGNAVFEADADDPQDQVTKTWEAKCPGFEDDPRNQIVGDDGDNVLVGTSGDDIICGRGGDDVLRGKGGDDLLLGGAGADVLTGGAGDDVLHGGGGRDTLRGGGGEDRLLGQGARDVLTGGARADTLIGGARNDILRGQAGNDTLKGRAGNDLLTGGNGNDDLRGNAGADTLKGGKGNDALNGGPGNDTCGGGPGNDSISNCED